MKVRDLIATLSAMDAHQDVREFELQAYDLDDEKWRPVTGLIVSPQKKAILVYTDEL